MNQLCQFLKFIDIIGSVIASYPEPSLTRPPIRAVLSFAALALGRFETVRIEKVKKIPLSNQFDKNAWIFSLFQNLCPGLRSRHSASEDGRIQHSLNSYFTYSLFMLKSTKHKFKVLKMKNLIIVGASRSGKSSLARMFRNKHNFNILSLDDLFQGFLQVFPEIGINEENEDSHTLLTPFIKTFVKCQIKYTYPELPVLIEGVRITTKDAIDIASIAPELFEVIAIGFPRITVDNKMSEIRKYDKPTDWSSRRSDDEMKRCIENGINYSKELEKECAELNIPFLDTSFDRRLTLEKFAFEFEKTLKI